MLLTLSIVFQGRRFVLLTAPALGTVYAEAGDVICQVSKLLFVLSVLSTMP